MNFLQIIGIIYQKIERITGFQGRLKQEGGRGLGDENYCRVKSYSGGAKMENKCKTWILERETRVNGL